MLVCSIGGCCLSTIFPARTMFSCRAFAAFNFLCSSATFNFNFADCNLRSSAVASCEGAGRSVLSPISIGAKFANGGGVSVVVSPGRILVGSSTVIAASGVVTSVLIASAVAETFGTGPGVLVVITAGVQVNGSFTISDGSGCVIVVAAVVLVDKLSVKIDDGSDGPV